MMDKSVFFSSHSGREVEAPIRVDARFDIGELVRHRLFDFRGVIFDIDPVFANTEEWYQSIPEAVRPRRDQPFYHLFAENDDGPYTAYVSQQNLVPDPLGDPIDHPELSALFELHETREGCLRYRLRRELSH